MYELKAELVKMEQSLERGIADTNNILRGIAGVLSSVNQELYQLHKTILEIKKKLYPS